MVAGEVTSHQVVGDEDRAVAGEGFRCPDSADALTPDLDIHFAEARQLGSYANAGTMPL